MKDNVKTSEVIIKFISDVNHRFKINAVVNYFIFNFKNVDHNGSWAAKINYFNADSYKYAIQINKDKKWVKR